MARRLSSTCDLRMRWCIRWCYASSASSQYRHGNDANLLLQQLPLGYVRLSADFAQHPLSRELNDEMREIIERAHRLGLKVIGQAVEDPQAAAALWMGGIDFIQGNLVKRAEHALDFDFKNATL